MSTHVIGSDIGGAWLNAFAQLLEAPTDGMVNLTVTIEQPMMEDRGVRYELEHAIARLRDTGAPGFHRPQSVHTVANTLFPISLYRRGHADAFFRNATVGQVGRGGKPTSWQPSGTYIGRLIRYPIADGRSTINQLEIMLDRLRSANRKDYYELGMEQPVADELNSRGHVSCTSGLHDGMPIYLPGFDNQIRGGQCLSHISLTLIQNRLSLTALYRHQVYVSRAYGNYLGLARLLAFLAYESGRDVGEIMVVASHADIDATRTAAESLLGAAVGSSGTDIARIEVESRPLGAPWRDLDLPVGVV
jgi:hypothetical protein